MTLFSIIHPTARPEKWREIYDAWMSNCTDPSKVQYILVTDQRWGTFHCDRWTTERGPLNLRVSNGEEYKHSGYVSSVNLGAKEAEGEILIVVADDQYPCVSWDVEIMARLAEVPEQSGYGRTVGFKPWVMEVSTGTPSEHGRGIMVMPILSWRRYAELGYVFYPEYESMFADNEFCEHAQADGVVIDGRRLMFPHKHWLNGFRGADAADRKQNDQSLYTEGQLTLLRRRVQQFASPIPRKESARIDKPAEQSSLTGAVAERPPVLAICTPGETFSYEFVANLRRIDYFLQHNFVLQPVMGHVTEPWRARQEMADSILTWAPKPDYVLWIDDDNLPTVEQIKTLHDALVAKNLDMVAGCCWIQFDGKGGEAEFKLSFGWFNEEKTASRMAVYSDLTGEIVEADWTGFPVVLMRREVLERAGKFAFRPEADDRFETGMMGEDISFCLHASERGGVKIHVHTGVRVPHLKLRAIEPEFAVRERAAAQSSVNGSADALSLPVNKPRIIGAMRLKNEGRWIKRCIESLFPLCETVYVMDDGSTDNTTSEVIAACNGQINRIRILRSPFIGRPLDEARDKQHLLELIQEEQSLDYILWIDGDEEMEPGGAEKILAAIAANPDCPAFNLRFYYLWNDTKTVRWDRWYAGVRRPSLFKNVAGMSFRSFYEGRGVHSGLHTSNCPYDLARDSRNLEVFLIHYGYIFAKDRIAKYEYYNRIDPNNQMEDNYRHMVIGDIFPRESRFAHAGPLELERLPFSIPPLDCESCPHLGEFRGSRCSQCGGEALGECDPTARECDTHEDFEREYARLVGAM